MQTSVVGEDVEMGYDLNLGMHQVCGPIDIMYLNIQKALDIVLHQRLFRKFLCSLGTKRNMRGLPKAGPLRD